MEVIPGRDYVREGSTYRAVPNRPDFPNRLDADGRPLPPLPPGSLPPGSEGETPEDE